MRISDWSSDVCSSDLILFVTSLADNGPGTYRACVEASGPRICIFRVSGLIRFTGRPPVIRNPYLTIAGQTAPGGGVTLAHSGGADGVTPVIIKKTQIGRAHV